MKEINKIGKNLITSGKIRKKSENQKNWKFCFRKKSENRKKSEKNAKYRKIRKAEKSEKIQKKRKIFSLVY